MTSVSGDPSNLMSGPEVQANVIETALRGFPLRTTPGVAERAADRAARRDTRRRKLAARARSWVLLLGLVVGVLFARRRTVAFDHGRIVLLVYPLIALGLSTLGAVVVSYETSAARERRLADSNCCKRLCRPLPNHSAKAPGAAHGTSRYVATALRLTPASAKPPSSVRSARASSSARTAARSASSRLLDRERDRAAQLACERPQLVGVGEAVAHRQLLDLGSRRSPRRASSRAVCSALRCGERVAAVGLARLQVAEVDHDRGGHRHPRVALALGPDREREAAAGSEHAADLAQRRRRVALEHVAEPREDAVDARVARARAAPRRARGTRRSRARARRRARRAASTMFGERSLEISRPASPRRAAARKPVSPVPAASSRIVCPGCGSSRSTSHSRDRARRLLEQVAAAGPSATPSPARARSRPATRRRGYSARSSASSSGEGSHSPAAAFARTCSGVVAPAITEATVGCAARPPIATSSSRSAARRGRTRRAPRRGPTSRRRRRDPARRGACPRAPARRGGTCPVSRPRASGKYGSSPSPSRSHSGIRSRSGVAREPRVLVLRRHVARQAARARGLVGLLDLRGREVRVADVAHLARADELVHRAERLLDRRDAVGPVVLVEVDVVGAELAAATRRSRART